MHGLTLAQRIAYFDSLTTYLGGFQRLILYCAPLDLLPDGRVSRCARGAAQFAAIFIPYIVLQFVAFKLLARGNGSLLLADRYAMAKFFTHIRSVTGYLTRRRLRFRVTPKGALANVPPGTFMPQLALVVATFACARPSPSTSGSGASSRKCPAGARPRSGSTSCSRSGTHG